MLQGKSPRQIPSCERSIFMKNLVAGTKFCPRDMSPEFKSVWIEGTCHGNKTTLHPGYTQGRLVWLFMRHVPATLRKINQSENEITACPCNKTLRVNTSRNLYPQHNPSCEQRMKFFPATCPCNMSPRVSRPIRSQNTLRETARSQTKRAVTAVPGCIGDNVSQRWIDAM